MRGERELYRDKIEVSLDGKQVFYLFFGAAVVACLVFVLGVMVGRRLESRAHADAIEAAEAAASDPLAALDLLAAGDGADDLSFPRELSREAPDVPPQPAPPPEEEDAEDKPEPAPEEKPEPAAEEKPEPAKPDEADEPEAKKPESTEARWTLQLSSFQDEEEATTFYNELRGAGYEPFITRAEVPEKGTWFRVRLGRYPDYESAIAAKAKFEERQQIIAYVTRL